MASVKPLQEKESDDTCNGPAAIGHPIQEISISSDEWKTLQNLNKGADKEQASDEQ